MAICVFGPHGPEGDCNMVNFAAPTYIDNELVLPVFCIMAVAFVVPSFIVVLAVRSVPSRLLLVGLLALVASIAFAAILPAARALTLVMAVSAAMLVLAGLLCTVVIWAVDLFRKPPRQAHGNSGM